MCTVRSMGRVYIVPFLEVMQWVRTRHGVREEDGLEEMLLFGNQNEMKIEK